MATFQYTAKVLDGSVKKGTMEVADAASLQQTLKAEGLFLVSCKELKEKDPKSLNALELAHFCRQMGSMLSSGIPLARAIAIFIKGDCKPGLRETYQKVGANIQSGMSLHRSMEQVEGVFPTLLIRLVAAGESKGDLDSTILKMADHYEAEHHLKVKMRNAAAYPLILLGVTLGVLLLIFTLVLPGFFALLQTADASLSIGVLMALSGAITHYWYLWIVGILALVAFIFLLLYFPRTRLAVDRLKIKLPGMGKLWRTLYTAQFVRTLHFLYSSGQTLLEALLVCRETIGNRYIEAQFEAVLVNLRQGQALSAALSEVDGFDAKLVSTIAVGEETNRLEAILASLTAAYDFEESRVMQRLTTILEPLLIIFMALVIGAILVAIIVPIYDMYNAIGQY